MSQKTKTPTPEHQEFAALYALDALDAKDRAAFERALVSDPDVAAETARLRETAGQLCFQAAPVTPPAGLREKVLAAATREEKPSRPGLLLSEPGLLISSSEQIPWAKHPAPGIWVKTLFVDRRRRYATSLVKLDPGAVYPSHRHKEVEELFVIEGDFEFHGQKLGPGDYCRAEAETVHLPARSVGGGVFLAISSLRDEMVT